MIVQASNVYNKHFRVNRASPFSVSRFFRRGRNACHKTEIRDQNSRVFREETPSKIICFGQWNIPKHDLFTKVALTMRQKLPWIKVHQPRKNGHRIYQLFHFPSILQSDQTFGRFLLTQPDLRRDNVNTSTAIMPIMDSVRGLGLLLLQI